MPEDDKSGKGQSGDQSGQGGNTGKDSGKDDDQGNKGQVNADGFTEEQQEKINTLLADERRREARKAEKLRKELEELKTGGKGSSGTSQEDPKVRELSDRLAKYEARETANKIAGELKIPKEEREKYLNHVTATDPDEIRDQLKAMVRDFGAKKTGTSANPAHQKKANKNDEINAYIRRRSGREV